MQIARKPLLRIFASADGSGIQLKARGPAAPLAKPVMDRINKIFADEKPIRSGPDKFIFSTWIPPAPSLAFDRMLSAQVGAMIRRPVPDQFSIAIMKACPNDCIHCSAPARQGEILESAIVKNAISQALDMGSYLITFDGGETMLRRDLPELVASVDERAVATAFTSGYHLTPELARQLKEAGLYAVRISIDSPFEKEHDRVRGRAGAFQDALSGVRNALAAGLLVDLFMVTSPHNIDYLEDAFSLAADLGAHELSLYEIVAVGRWAAHEDEVLDADDVARLERFHKEKNRTGGPRPQGLGTALSAEPGDVRMLCRAPVDSCGWKRRGSALRLHAPELWEYQRKKPEGDLEGDDPLPVVQREMLLPDEGAEVQSGA